MNANDISRLIVRLRAAKARLSSDAYRWAMYDLRRARLHLFNAALDDLSGYKYLARDRRQWAVCRLEKVWEDLAFGL